MSEYGSGVSLTQAFNYDKERLLQALDGKLICGETEEGFVYAEATPAECRDFIITVFDNAVYHALQGYRSGKIMEKVAEANGVDIYSGQTFLDYQHFMQKLAEEETELYDYGDPSEYSEEDE